MNNFTVQLVYNVKFQTWCGCMADGLHTCISYNSALSSCEQTPTLEQENIYNKCSKKKAKDTKYQIRSTHSTKI